MREMKDSGIEWIGKIPKDWSYSKVKYHCSMKSGDNITSLNIEETSHYPVYGGNGQRGYFSQYNVDADKILIGRQGALAGNVHYVSGKFWATDHAIVTTPFKDINILYFFYLLKGYELNRYAQDTAAQPGLAVSKIMNLAIYLPSVCEQQQIADYLDTKCSEIDATAEDIQKEISLLEDYKKSVITEAVTKGLNPDAEMKDSGIEWIGDIPKDWVTIRIGNIFSLRNERNYLPMEQVQLLSLYSGKGVFPTGEEGTTNSGNHAQTVADYKIVKRNDIVVNIILAWMGSLGISNYDGVVSPAYDVYIPDEEKVVPHYYHYVFRTSGIANECYRYGRGIMMMRWRTYSSEFKRIHVPFPSFDEQQQIADYLDSKCSEIDTLIADKKRQLDILADYKKSIIYEYVTGKKEVLVKDF